MRISTDVNDPGYHPHASYVKVFLAGAERSNVVTADEAARFVTQIRLDEFGIPVKGKDGKAVLDEFFGDVRVDCAPWLREAMEAPQEDDGGLSGALFAMIQTP